jgi:hypothetical protein
MRSLLGLALSSLCVAYGTAALACDACLEDKIAATYDWQIVSSAKRAGHTVVFTAIQGPVAPGDAGLERRLSRLSVTPGVDAGSMRTSLAPPALSFACDLRRRKVAEVLAAMNRALRDSGLRLALVRVGAPSGPAKMGSP